MQAIKITKEQQMKPINIKWVLAHEPIDIFIRAAQEFSRVLELKAPGQVNIEILTLGEYSQKYNNGVKVTKQQLLDLMESGAIEMSQMYTYVLSKYNKDLDALDMPFLFEDHDHAARVFEGPIGQELLEGYSKNSNIKGMAFTYSGGFINLPFGKDVKNLSDIAGAKVRVSRSPVAAATWAAVGAEPVQMEVEEVTDGIRDGKIEGGESSWPRVYSSKQNEVASTIIDSDHRLLLTNIIIDNKFFNSLDADLQAAMMESAIEAGRFERAISVADVEPTIARCKQDGINVFKLSEQDRAKFKTTTESLYDQFEDYFTPGLVAKIQQAKYN